MGHNLQFKNTPYKHMVPDISTWTFLYNLRYKISISQLISQPNFFPRNIIILLVTQDQHVRVILDSSFPNSCLVHPLQCVSTHFSISVSAILIQTWL